VISSFKCGVVLFVVLCDVWFRVFSRCLFNSYWKIDINQLQSRSMIWASTLQIWKHGYFGGLDFIILFVGILPLYVINLGVVSLFTDSSFTFLAMFVSDCDVLYQFEWMNIVLFLSKKSFWSFLVHNLNIWLCWELTQNWESDICKNRATILGLVLRLLSREKSGHDLWKSGHDCTLKDKNKKYFLAWELFQILRVLFLYKYKPGIRWKRWQSRKNKD